MNQKKAKQLREKVGYNPNANRTELSTDYNVRDTSEVLGYIKVGVNVDGTDKLEQMIAIKCTATLKDGVIRKAYQQSKKSI